MAAKRKAAADAGTPQKYKKQHAGKKHHAPSKQYDKGNTGAVKKHHPKPAASGAKAAKATEATQQQPRPTAAPHAKLTR